MGRGKVVMKRIENMSSRLVTFSKRKDGLMKKAEELAVLCGVDVAVIVFSNEGKRFEYSSSRMESILEMYNEAPKSSELAIVDTVASEEPRNEEDALRAEISALRRMQSGLLAKGLQELSITDLQQLEHTFNEGLLSIKNHMGRKLMGQLELSQLKEEKARIESKMLREEIEHLRVELAMKENSVAGAETVLRSPKAKNDAEKPMIIE